MKKWVGALIAVMLAGTTPVLAGPPGGMHPGLVTFTEGEQTLAGPPGLVKQALPFLDLEEASWSIPYVVNAYLKNILRGYPDGRFQPNAAVSQAEAVVTVIRALGLEEEALETPGIPPLPGIQACMWARGHLLLAAELSLIDLGTVQPNRAASRSWVIMLLVKAMDLPVIPASLEFVDAQTVLAVERDYLAAALQAGLITGYEDGSLRPHRAVSRAEMAALIQRMLEARDETTVIEGLLTMVTATYIRVNGVRYDLADQVTVVRDGRLIPYSQLTDGYPVRVSLDGQGRAALIVATSVSSTYGGVITALAPNFILDVAGQEHTFALADQVNITLDGLAALYGQLAVGYQAWVKTNPLGQLVTITATSANRQYTGIVDYVTATTLRLQVEERLHAFVVSDGAQVTVDGQAATLNDVYLGYQVQVTLSASGEVTSLVVLERLVIREGSIATLDLHSIGVRVGTVVYLFALPQAPTIALDGVTAEREDLLLGDPVRVEARAGYAHRIDAQALVTTIIGMLMGVDLTQSRIQVRVEGEVTEVKLAQDAVISYGADDEWVLSDLNLGSLVEVQLRREEAFQVEVLEHLQTMTGLIVALDLVEGTITLEGYPALKVTQDTLITLDGVEATLDALSLGDAAEVSLSAHLALFIHAQTATSE